MAVIKMMKDGEWKNVFCGVSQTQNNFPEFTESDNGKVLTIVDGVMTWAEATGGINVPSAMGVGF